MVDPSAFAPFNLTQTLGDIAKLRYMQAESQAKMQELAEKKAEREALSSIFGGVPASPQGAPPGPTPGSVPTAAGGQPGSLGSLATQMPPNQQAIGTLMRANPELGMQVQKYFSGLRDDERKQEADKWQKTAPVLVQLQQMPYQQRRAYLQAATPALQAFGWSPDEVASFDPTDQNVSALSHAAMTVDQVVNSNAVKWNQIGENGSFATDQFGNPVGDNNPFAPGGPGVAPPPPNGRAPLNNNPGALRVPGSMQFQSFSSPQQGIQAQEALLTRYMGGGLKSVSSIVEKYAPRKSKGGDNTDAQVNNYIGYVSQRLGVNPNDTLSPALLPRLAQAMREFETGNRQPSGGPRNISSKAEFDALPSGTHFIAPDGTERVKP